MRPVRVCCFCEKWESGGIESFLHNVFLPMDPEAVQVDIVAAELSESIFTQSLREHGVRFVALSGTQRNLRTNHRMFRDLLRAEKYDVVHLNVFHGLSLCYAHLAKSAGVPLRIAHSHNTALRQSRTRPLKQIVHCAAKELFTGSATDLWTCSAAAGAFLFSRRALRAKGCRFVPNGIDISRFRFEAAVREQIRRELSLEGRLVVGSVGRLCYQKNQDFLLEVFAEVVRLRPESRLLLIGEGEAEAALRRKAERLGIAGAVIFYGTSRRVEQLLWAMDVFVFPSRFEGLGIAAVEAQAAGVPVLCSEYVPREAHVTPQCWSLSLHDGPRRWADKLLEASRMRCDRTESAAAVQRAGFDVADVSAGIEASYMRSLRYGYAENFRHRTGLQGGALSPEMSGQYCRSNLSEPGDHPGG